MEVSAAGQADSLVSDEYDKLAGLGAVGCFTLWWSLKDFQHQYLTVTSLAGSPSELEIRLWRGMPPWLM